jgi:hypothetical protein
MTMKKRLLISGGIVFAVAFLAIGGLLSLDRVARAAIVRGGKSALGVPVKVKDVDLGLLAGKIDLDGMSIANPPGFEGAEFAALHKADLKVNFASLRHSVVRAPQLVLDGVTLNLERSGGQMNYSPIVEHIRQREAKPPADHGKKFIVNEVVIRNVEARLDLLPVGDQLTRAVIHLPEVRLKNVGTAGDAASISSMIDTIIKALLNATIQSSAQELPVEFVADFKRSLESLKSQAVDVREGVTTAIEKIGNDAARRASSVLDEVKNQLPSKEQPNKD